MSDLDRITPYTESGSIEDRIDEIVRGDVHIEMMSNRTAWMRIGREIFWIEAVKGKLVIRYSETWPEASRASLNRSGDAQG